jgi:hypothetical protein
MFPQVLETLKINGDLLSDTIAIGLNMQRLG